MSRLPPPRSASRAASARPSSPDRPRLADCGDAFDLAAAEALDGGGDPRARVAAALRAAHAAGARSQHGTPDPGVRTLLADMATALADGGEPRLDQPMGPCPGMPWHLSVSGALVAADGYALAFPDAAVRSLAAMDGLRIEGAVATPGPGLQGLLPAVRDAPAP